MASVRPETIDEVFRDVSPLQWEEILHNRCKDASEILGLLPYAGINWRNIPDAVIENNYSALPFLSPKAFLSFIPAFLKYSVRFPESTVCLYTWFAATGPCSYQTQLHGDDIQEHYESQLSLLSNDERQLLRDFACEFRPEGLTPSDS